MKTIRFIAALLFALLALAAPRPAWATDYYVSGYATWGAANPVGSDAANGTSPNTPKATFASLDGTLAAGDTLWVAGVHFSSPGNPFALVSKNNVSIRQWPGQTQAHIHGGVRAAMTGWTQSSNRYNITIGAGKVITGATWNYHTSQDANGMRRAWLAPVASAAACSSTAWSHFYDSAAGVLYINANGGSPNSGSDVVTYVEYTGSSATSANLNGVYVESSSGVVIEGLHTSGFIGSIGSTTYYCNGIQLYTCTDSVVSGCSDWDAGIHNFVFAGLACSNNLLVNSAGYGGMSRVGTGADGGTTVAFYNGAGDVTGCRGVRVTAVCGNCLTPAGAELDATAVWGAFLTHTNGGSNYARDVEWRECTVKCLNINVEPIVGGNNLPSGVTATPDVWTSYPVRFVDGRVSGAGGTLPTSAAIVRTRFDLNPLASDPSDTCLNTVAGTASNAFRLFIACDFVMHADVDDQKIIATANNWDDRFYHCSFLIDRSAAVTFREFIGWSFSTSGQVTARNCIFADNSATGTTYLCVNDGSTAANKHLFANCSYYNIDLYSANTALDAKAEWLANCDTVATDDASGLARHFPAALPFADSNGPELALSPSSKLRTYRRPYGNIRQPGINKRPWSGHLGSWQYPLGEVTK